jgi:hypothetical protein
MAIGRISGQMLSSSLDRQSNLSFINNTATTMHLDFTGSKVGINTDNVTETLTVNGTIGTANTSDFPGMTISASTLKAKNNGTLYIGSQIDLGDLSTINVGGGTGLDIITTDGAGTLTWTSANVWLANSNFLQNLTINGSTLSTSVTNGNVTIQGNGTGSVVSSSMYVTNLNATNLTSANINGVMSGSFTGNLVGTILTPEQPYITSVGTLTGLSTTGNIYAPFVNAALRGPVYTNNIYDVNGNLTIHTQPGAVLTIDSTAAQVLPVGSTAQRPTTVAGAIRYNADAMSPEYFNGTTWVVMKSDVSSQTLYGNDSSDTFPLDHYTTASGVIVSINGTVQQPAVAYNIDPTNSNFIVFTEVPKYGDLIEVRFLSTTTLVEFAQQNAMSVNSPTITYGTVPIIIDEFRMADFRSAKYTVSAMAANGNVLMSDVMVIHNGITVSFSAASAGDETVATFAAVTAAGNVRVTASSIANGASLKIYKLYFPI